MLSAITVSGLMIDEMLGVPVAILSGKDSSRALRIPLHPMEAGAIAMALSGQKTAASYPTDLSMNILSAFCAELERSVIHDFRDGVACARLELIANGERFLIECRPGDAIILSLRKARPLFVEEWVLAAANGISSTAENLRSHIVGIDTMAFGDCIIS